MDPYAGAVHHHQISVLRIGHGRHDPVPDARLRPPVEAVIDRRVGTVLRGQIAPGTAHAQRMENAIDHPAVVNAWHAAGLVGQDAFDEFPLKVAHI